MAKTQKELLGTYEVTSNSVTIEMDTSYKKALEAFRSLTATDKHIWLITPAGTKMEILCHD